MIILILLNNILFFEAQIVTIFIIIICSKQTKIQVYLFHLVFHSVLNVNVLISQLYFNGRKEVLASVAMSDFQLHATPTGSDYYRLFHK